VVVSRRAARQEIEVEATPAGRERASNRELVRGIARAKIEVEGAAAAPGEGAHCEHADPVARCHMAAAIQREAPLTAAPVYFSVPPKESKRLPAALVEAPR